MKLLHIAEFSTEEGSNKTTTLPLDTRTGVYFKIVTSTYESAYFDTNMQSVPIQMKHEDRSPLNVNVKVSKEQVEIFQYYQQADKGLLFSYVNDDWVDSSELREVIIDSMKIDKVSFTTGLECDVTPSMNGTGVSMRFRNETAPTVSETITTLDGHTYLLPLQWTKQNVTVGDQTTYQYHNTNVARALKVYATE